MKYFKYITATFLLIVLVSCVNEYEKEAIGEYTVDKFSLKDSSLSNLSKDIKSYKLYLLEDKTMKIDLKNRELTGMWKAGDDGDRTFVEFNIDGVDYQGVIVGRNNEIIQIVNPDHFILDNIMELSFKKNEDVSKLSR